MSRQEYVMMMANMSAADAGAVLADDGQDDDEYGDLTAGVQVVGLDDEDDEGEQQGEAGA